MFFFFDSVRDQECHAFTMMFSFSFFFFGHLFILINYFSLKNYSYYLNLLSIILESTNVITIPKNFNFLSSLLQNFKLAQNLNLDYQRFAISLHIWYIYIYIYFFSLSQSAHTPIVLSFSSFARVRRQTRIFRPRTTAATAGQTSLNRAHGEQLRAIVVRQRNPPTNSTWTRWFPVRCRSSRNVDETRYQTPYVQSDGLTPSPTNPPEYRCFFVKLQTHGTPARTETLYGMSPSEPNKSIAMVTATALLSHATMISRLVVACLCVASSALCSGRFTVQRPSSLTSLTRARRRGDPFNEQCLCRRNTQFVVREQEKVLCTWEIFSAFQFLLLIFAERQTEKSRFFATVTKCLAYRSLKRYRIWQ